MGFRDKVSEAKDTAANAASGGKEAVSERTDGAKEIVSGAKGGVSGKANRAKERVAEGLPNRSIDSSAVGEKIDGRMPTSSLTSVSYERFSSPNIHVRPAIQRHGGKAADVVREASTPTASNVRTAGKAANVARDVDFRRALRFGKVGFKQGKKYGDYIPVAGGFLPYVGFAAGIGVVALDDADVLSADKVVDISSSLSDATEQVVQSDSQKTTDNLVTGGVVFADSYWGEPEEESMKDLLGMDFDEFAGRQ